MRTRLLTLLAVLLCTTTSYTQTVVSTDYDLRAAVQINNANIIVGADIDLSNSTLNISDNRTVTLDLGGHALDRKLTKRGEGGGQVITVRKGATLNLSNGTLKGGWGRDGGGLVNEGGTVTLTDVNITGNTADDRGGGISNHGTLTMTRGSITGNKTNDQTDPKGGGGIMNSKGATATLTNVTITGNTVGTYGGGGICNFGTLTLDGGTITGNKVGTHGGGIWQEGTLSMQGAMTVTGNMGPGGMTNNLFLKTNAIVTITGSLAGSTVGVNMEATAGIFTSGYSTYNSGTDPATIFTPDISDVMAVSLDGNEAKLASILPEGAVYYIECSWDSHNKKVVNTTKILSRKIGYSDTPTEGDYKLVTNSKNEDDWFQLGGYSDDNDEYYVVTGNVSNNTLNVLGKKVHLILCDGAKLTLSGGILCYGDNYKLNIHSQSYGPSMGKLIAESGYDDGVAGIGSDCVISWHGSWNHNEWGHFLPDENTRIPSDIEIHGGDIYAQGSEQAAGIGGGNAQSGGNLIIYGGKITAKGGAGNSSGEGAAGIGGGNLGDAGNIKIYGGTVEAWGGRSSAGIGGGEGLRSGNIEIYDGNVVAHGGEQGAGIGSGMYAQDITVTINGGIVKAYGNDGGAGIGSGKGSGMTYRSGIININGGEVYAYGSDDAAGIGGGNDVNGADVTITGGYVYAKGDGNGAGIGSGCEGIWDGGKQGGRFTMTGGEVYAYGGVDAAGIGGGEDADGGTITISGGYVYAEGQDYGPGIGGGQGGKGGDVTINGGIVIAKAGRNETGMRAIGPGEGCDDYGSLTIGDAMMVSSERMAAAVERKNMCWYRTQARIEPCTHPDHTYTVSGTGLDDKHTEQCAYCTTPFTPEKHTFVNNVCSVCGVAETTETHTVSYYLPSNTVNTEYGEPTVYQYIKGETITLPTAPDNIVPNDLTFAGWHMGTPALQESIIKQPSESLVAAGTEYTVDSDVSFAARYDYIHLTLANAAHNGEMLARYNGKQAQDVTLKDRTLYRDGRWNTQCLPFNVNAFEGSPLQGATVKTLKSTSFADGTLTINFSDNVTSIEAGKPYIVKWNTTQENITDPVFNNVTLSNTLNPVETTAAEGVTITFAGAYSPMFIGMERKNILYLGPDNTLYYPDQAMTIGSCRGHFRLKGISAGDPTVSAIELNFGGETTAISEGLKVKSEKSAPATVWHTLDGRKLSGKPTQKGVYINNGKKRVIK